jgi:glycine/D-amino acid oxidase-like deaminating enzyme
MNNAVGIGSRVLTPDELHALEPRLDPAAEFTGAAVWEPESGFADPYLTAQSYAAAAKDKGVEIRVGTRVESIRANGKVQGVVVDGETIEASKIIVAAGYRTKELVAPFGFDAPLTPVRHTMAVVQRTKDFGAAHPVISDRVFGVYFRPDVGNLTLVGTTAPYDGQVDYAIESERPADEGHVENQAERFLRRFPSEQAASLRDGFSGVYDCSADLQPLLGPLPGVEGLYIMCGFSGHGFKLSPAIGELMAEKVLEDKTSLVDIDFFRPSRFIENKPIKMQFSYSVPTL